MFQEVTIGAEESERGKIEKSHFVDLYKEIGTRPEVYFLMVRYANKDYLSCQDLRLFLETEQGVSWGGEGIGRDFNASDISWHILDHFHGKLMLKLDSGY